MGLIRIIFIIFLVLSASQAAAQLITRAQLVPLSNYVATKQHGTAALTNIAGLSSTVFTNVPLGGTNISVRTAGGTNFIDTTGELNNWALYPTNVWNSRQGGSSLLTNWQGTGVLTNIVNASTNWPAGQVGLLGPTNNGDVRIKSLSAGANITLTDQLTNIAIASTGAGGGVNTNANQFGAAGATLTLKDGLLVTNMIAYGFTNNGVFSNSSAAFIGGFLDAKGPNTNRVQLNLPHLTVSRAAIINAQGDITNSAGVTDSELEFIATVTSDVQTQLNGKQNGQTNANQFGANVVLTLRDGVTVTNLNNIGTLHVTNPPGSSVGLRIWATNGFSYNEFDVIDPSTPTALTPTNRFVFSVTNPTAGQVFKFNSVSIASGVATIIVTNDTDQTSAGGAGWPAVDSLASNITFRSSATNNTNIVIEQRIGQLVPVLAFRDSNNAPTLQIDNRGFLWMTNGLTNLSRGNTRPVSDNNIAIGATFHGGLSVPTWTDDRARTFSLGPNVMQEEVYYIIPGTGSTPFVHGLTTGTAGGTSIAMLAPDERRPTVVLVSSAATSNSVGGICINANIWNAGAHNGSSRVGGGFFFSRWMITNNIAGIVGGGAPRFFVGLANAASPNFTNIVNTTNGTGEYLGLMGDPKQSLNMFITARDAGAEFRTNTGINFVATNLYELAIEEAHTNRFVRWSLRDITARLEASGTFSNAISTNFMKPVIMSKNGTNRANEIMFTKLYVHVSQHPRWN